MSNEQELRKKLAKIQSVFNIKRILSLRINKAYIQKYYLVNKIPYSLFHSSTDLIYMGISRDGKFKEEDLLEAARTVERYVHRTRAQKVLELATGRGANSLWLALRHKDTKFYGVDISKEQLILALKKSKQVSNYHPDFGDYHDLKKYSADMFDVVFVVEALCYSTTKEKVLSEVSRVLRPGGFFVIFDGYSNKKTNELTPDELLAKQLTEHGMAITEFETYYDFKEKISNSGLKIEFEENLSLYVLPTMQKFERIASVFFGFPILPKIITKVLPYEFTYNSISGYLMPLLIKLGLNSYWVTVLQKR